MKIIIIGCGKVGFTLARQLSGENHELVLIDHRAEAMQVADSTLDLMCVEGSGASIQTLREAGVFQRLEDMGIQDGDTVSMDGWEFDYFS